MAEYGHTGTSQCRSCKSINPWRSDRLYKVGDGIWPGFLGECRICHRKEFQTITQLTDNLEEARQLSTPKEKTDD